MDSHRATAVDEHSSMGARQAARAASTCALPKGDRRARRPDEGGIRGDAHALHEHEKVPRLFRQPERRRLE